MSWAHMTDKEFADDIRHRVAEINDMIDEAASRDIIINVSVNPWHSFSGHSASKQALLTTTISQRI